MAVQGGAAKLDRTVPGTIRRAYAEHAEHASRCEGQVHALNDDGCRCGFIRFVHLGGWHAHVEAAREKKGSPK